MVWVFSSWVGITRGLTRNTYASNVDAVLIVGGTSRYKREGRTKDWRIYICVGGGVGVGVGLCRITMTLTSDASRQNYMHRRRRPGISRFSNAKIS